MTRDYPLLIGACGWSHAGWNVDFYPQDLPSDWRLGYYANEFPVALVTMDEWQLSGADPVIWCEESEASFRFVLEIHADTVEDVELQLHRAVAFADRCAGSLLRTRIIHDVEKLEGLLDCVTAFSPVCMDFANQVPGADVLNLLIRKEVGWCWHGDGESYGLLPGPLAVSRISANVANPRQIRDWVETCLRAGDEQCQSILLFDGAPPNIEVIRQAQVILDLL